MQNSEVGIAWYRPEQWEKLRLISKDKNNLERTHSEWLKSAEDLLIKLDIEGFNVVRFEVDVEELLKWCQKNKRPVDGKARSHYVQEMLQSKNQ
jgi:hypothetical protein